MDDAEGTVEPALSHIPSHLRLWLVAGAVLWADLWSKQWVFENLPDNRSEPFINGFIEFRRSLNDGAVFGSLTGHVELFITASLFALGFVLYFFASSARTHRGLHVALGLVLAGALGNMYDRALVKADIVSYHRPTGEEVTVIGKIIEEPVERHTPPSKDIRVGSWPDGANPQVIRRSRATVRKQGVVRDFIKFVPKFPSWVPKFGGNNPSDIWPWVFNVADAALVCGVGALLCTSWLDRRLREQP
jgi:lipoprotein signal peptidase